VKPTPDIAELARGVAARDAASVARAISLVEDRRSSVEPSIVAFLGQLSRERMLACRRVGVTGPPGVGKSTLCSALTRVLRAKGSSVGVLAVDPSSPRSGGALLGDRARMEMDPEDHDVFVRSMASGGHLGGLARAAGAAVDVLSAAFDWVLVETTGVGQSETDVEHVADTVLLVIQPASGDMLQFIKAGILEIPDVLAVNKADLGDVAVRAGAELRSALGAVAAGSQLPWSPPVIHTSTVSGAGIEQLVGVLGDHRAYLERQGTLTSRRVQKSGAWALRLFTQRYGELAVEDAGGDTALGARFAKLIAGGSSSLAAVAQLAPR
jgi:LAO/AO transport system kinase